MKPSTQSTKLLLAALALGLCADQLFYGKSPGLSWLLFVTLFVVALTITGRSFEISFARQNRWLLLPLFFFAAMIAIRANPFLIAFNILVILCLLGYLVVYFAAGRVQELNLSTALFLPIYTAAKSLVAAGPHLAQSVKSQGLRPRRYTRALPVAKGSLLAFPVLVVFAALLSSADIIFADRLGNLLGLLRIRNLLQLTGHGLFILIFTWLAAGGLAIALSQRNAAETLDEGLNHVRRPFFLGFVESTTILVLISLLFLAFVSVQFQYLFGGQANLDAAGYTYSEYARRGFFELVTVAVLSLGLILGLDWLTWRESKRQLKLFNTLGSLMIALVLIMLVSAFYRMRLYEATYGYTQLRLYVYVFMIWLAILLIWFLLTLWRWPGRLVDGRFAIGLIVVVIGFLATLNLLNPDAFIVRRNLARYLSSGDLDVPYLQTLSADAVPQLLVTLDALEGDQTTNNYPWCERYQGEEPVEACGLTRAQILAEDLSNRLHRLQNDTGWRRWQSLNLARLQAHHLLQQTFS